MLKNLRKIVSQSSDEGRGGSSSGSGLGEAGSGNVDGLDKVGGLGSVGAAKEDEKKVGMPSDAPTHQKRQRFDKDGQPLISKGILIRADIDRKYSIKATILHAKKYELVNDALLYYYENVLNKPKSQKLKEAGQEELDI